MSRAKLKCWIGNYDGERQGMVIATSKRAARRVINVSAREFEDYWSEQRVVPAGYEVEALYTRTLSRRLLIEATERDPGWVKGRCSL